MNRGKRHAAIIIEGIKTLQKADGNPEGKVVYREFIEEYNRFNDGDQDSCATVQLLYAVLRYAAMLSGLPDPEPPKVGWWEPDKAA